MFDPLMCSGEQKEIVKEQQKVTRKQEIKAENCHLWGPQKCSLDGLPSHFDLCTSLERVLLDKVKCYLLPDPIIKWPKTGSKQSPFKSLSSSSFCIFKKLHLQRDLEGELVFYNKMGCFIEKFFFHISQAQKA